jgi:hypothetical protein
MPIYILKRYHKVIPTGAAIWSLGRELAFEASDAVEAIILAKNQHAADHAPFGGLTIVLDPDGKRIWESVD